MRKISESAWGDMMRRGSGENIRTEDGVNLLDLDGLYDYIKSRYDKKVFYLDKTWYNEIYVDVLTNISLILKPDGNGGLLHVLLSWSKEKISMSFFDKLSERFKVENPSVNRRIIKEKDGTCTNQTYIDVIDFFLDNIDNILVTESAWGDMMRRGSGEEIREEDDINNFGLEELCDYLRSNYESIAPYDATIYVDEGYLTICLFEDTAGYLSYLYYDESHITTQKNVFELLDCERELKQKYLIQLKTNRFGVENVNIYPKNQAEVSMSNSFFIEVLDFILDRVEKPLEKQIKRKNNMNESAWGDMMRRGSGEEVRGEDTGFLNSVKADIRCFAKKIVYEDLYKNSIDDFKEFMSKSYKNNMYDSKTHENVGKKMVKDIVIYVEANWNKGKNYESQVNEEINKEEEKIKKLGFVKEPGKSIEKTLNDWWDSYPYKDDLMYEINQVLTDEEKYYDPDDMWNDSDFETQIETYLKEKGVNESAWGDMMRRGSGEQIRKEDEITQTDMDAIVDSMNEFAIRVVWDNEKFSREKFCKCVREHLKFNEDINIVNIIKYIDSHWTDDIEKDIEGFIKEEEKEKENGMNESAWGDMMRRGSGEDNRIEDEILSDKEINSLNQFTLMYCRRERAHYIQNHIVPPPPSCRKENDCEGLIKYIEKRRDENLFTNVGDYDKIIEYIKKNWDRLDMDTYIKKRIFSPGVMDGKKIVECDGVPGGATPANVGGMGAAYFPGPNGEPGSGDLPSPTGIVYHQVAPYTTFLKQIKKKKKKAKKFRKEDEPCVHSPNAKVYDYVDDFRDYVDRTYNNINRI